MITDSGTLSAREIEDSINKKIESNRRLDFLELEKAVGESIKNHVDGRFAEEKALIVSYIGIGLKIALGSVALTILIFGFFG